jgi:hypothetical protein
MPILDSRGNTIVEDKPHDGEKARTVMAHLPLVNADAYSEEIGKNVRIICGNMVQFNPVSAMVMMAQAAAVMYNSVNFPTIEEKVEAEKMIRAIFENGLKNGDDFDNPAPALIGNALLGGPQPH